MRVKVNISVWSAPLRAITDTIISVIAFGRNDPVVPTQLFEADIQRLLTALIGSAVARESMSARTT